MPRNDRWGGISLDGEIGNNCLPQGDAAVITGHLPVGEDLETTAFQQANCLPQQ